MFFLSFKKVSVLSECGPSLKGKIKESAMITGYCEGMATQRMQQPSN